MPRPPEKAISFIGRALGVVLAAAHPSLKKYG